WNASILMAQGPILRVLHRAEVALVLTFIWIPIALTSIRSERVGDRVCIACFSKEAGLTVAPTEGLDSPSWLENVGRAAVAIGSDAFYDRLLDLACRLIRHDKSMVVRYSRVSAPQCLLYRDYSEHIIQLWLSGYYRFDPFYDHWREHERRGITTLS